MVKVTVITAIFSIVTVVSVYFVFFHNVYHTLYFGQFEEIGSFSFTPNGAIVNTSDRVIYFSNYSPNSLLIKRKVSNQLMSSDGEEIFSCVWINREINDPDQSATYLMISSRSYKRIVKFSLSVKPLMCAENMVHLIDNYPNNPGREFIFRDGELKQIAKENPTTHQDTIPTLPSSIKEKLPPTETIDRIYNHDFTLIQDNLGGIWIIYKTTPLRKGISYLRQHQISELSLQRILEKFQTLPSKIYENPSYKK